MIQDRMPITTAVHLKQCSRFLNNTIDYRLNKYLKPIKIVLDVINWDIQTNKCRLPFNKTQYNLNPKCMLYLAAASGNLNAFIKLASSNTNKMELLVALCIATAFEQPSIYNNQHFTQLNTCCDDYN